MASLIIAATYLTYSKIKDKRDQRKEKKRQGYQKRYDELERERTREDEEFKSKKAGSAEAINEGSDSVVASGTGFPRVEGMDAEKYTHNPQRDEGEEDEKRDSMTNLSPVSSGRPERRRSMRSSTDDGGSSLGTVEDDPSAWVDSVLRDLSATRYGGPPKDSIDLGRYDDAAKMRSLI